MLQFLSGLRAAFNDSKIDTSDYQPIFMEDISKHTKKKEDIYDSNSTLEWSAERAASDAPQRNAPGRVNFTLEWSAEHEASDAP